MDNFPQGWRWGLEDFVIWVTSNCLAPLIVSSGPEDFTKLGCSSKTDVFKKQPFCLKITCVFLSWGQPMETTASRRTSGDQVKLKNIFSPFFLSFFSFSNLRLLNSHTSPIKITQSWNNFFCSLERSLNPVLLKLWCLWKIWDQWKLWRCCCLLEVRLLWSELEQELTTVFSIPAKGCSCHQTKLLPYITILTWSKYKYHKAIKADVVFSSPTMNV